MIPLSSVYPRPSSSNWIWLACRAFCRLVFFPTFMSAIITLRKYGWMNVYCMWMRTLLSIIQNEKAEITSQSHLNIDSINIHILETYTWYIPEVVHFPLFLLLSDGLVLPQLLEQLRLGLAAVRQSGGGSRCSCNQFRIKCLTGKHSAERLESVDESGLQISSQD